MIFFDISAVSTAARPSTSAHSARRSHWHRSRHYLISYRSHCHCPPGSVAGVRPKCHPGHSVSLLALPHRHHSRLALGSLRFKVGVSGLPSVVYLSKAFNLSTFLIKTAAN